MMISEDDNKKELVVAKKFEGTWEIEINAVPIGIIY